MTGMLLDAHTRLMLEQDSERLSIEQLEPPSFSETIMGQFPDQGEPRRVNLEGDHRVRRVVEELEPVQCSKW